MERPTVLIGRPRYELKFIIDLSAKESLIQAIRGALTTDKNGDRFGAYRVSSLYYDTEDLQAYYEKLDGVLRRQKYRLRYYGEPQDSPEVAFFEIKHRFANLISKERMRLSPETTRALLSLEAPLRSLSDTPEAPQTPLVGRMLRASLHRPLKPAVIVSYLREAWVGTDDPDLRVTFDHVIEGFLPGDYLSPGKVSGRACLPPDQLVLEVKFDHFLPRWLRQRLVQRGLRPVRYSKYLEAADACQLVAVGGAR